jgi:hypothetical protein
VGFLLGASRNLRRSSNDFDFVTQLTRLVLAVLDGSRLVILFHGKDAGHDQDADGYSTDKGPEITAD